MYAPSPGPFYFDSSTTTVDSELGDYQTVTISSSDGCVMVRTVPRNATKTDDWLIRDDMPHIVSVLTEKGARPMVKERA